MVKEFLKCNSIRERIQFLANTVLKDWDASELDTVMDIMGLSKEGMEAPEDKISAIEKYLADYKHEVEMRGGIDGSRVDGIPAKDQGSTLFEGPSEAEVVSMAEKLPETVQKVEPTLEDAYVYLVGKEGKRP